MPSPKTTPETKAEAVADATSVKVEPTAVAEATPSVLPSLKVAEHRADAEGIIRGLEPRTRYLVLKVEGKTREVQELPFARMAPPTVRRSALIVITEDDPSLNPVV